MFTTPLTLLFALTAAPLSISALPTTTSTSSHLDSRDQPYNTSASDPSSGNSLPLFNSLAGSPLCSNPGLAFAQGVPAGTVIPKLNFPACQYLVNTHLPSIMDVNTVGQWVATQTYTWNLGTNNAGGYQANDCTITLGRIGGASMGSVDASGGKASFAPSLFLNAASDVLGNCGPAGGREILMATDPAFQVSIVPT